jgi:hypothetical protein
MGIPSGLGAQVGMVAEVTYGTAVTVTRFFEFIDESFDFTRGRMESAALRPGTRIMRSDDWAASEKAVGGSLGVELQTKGLGILLKHAFGGVATSQPDAPGNPTVYEHLFTPGDLPAATVQVGRPDTAGTAQPFTYTGCVVKDWEISVDAKGIGQLKLTFVGQDERLDVALATATYPTSPSLLTWVQGAATVAGGAAKIKKFNLKGTNGLDDDRYFLGSALREKPLENAMREVTGVLEAEFDTTADYDRFRDGTETEIELDFVGPAITGSYNYGLTITVNARIDGKTPTVGGPGVLQRSVPFKVVDNGTTSVKALYRTTDTTP